MSKFHISKDGVARQCRAQTPASCTATKAGYDEHYDTAEEAQRAYEEKMEKTAGKKSGLKKKDNPNSIKSVAADTQEKFNTVKDFYSDKIKLRYQEIQDTRQALNDNVTKLSAYLNKTEPKWRTLNDEERQEINEQRRAHRISSLKAMDAAEVLNNPIYSTSLARDMNNTDYEEKIRDIEMIEEWFDKTQSVNKTRHSDQEYSDARLKTSLSAVKDDAMMKEVRRWKDEQDKNDSDLRHAIQKFNDSEYDENGNTRYIDSGVIKNVVRYNDTDYTLLDDNNYPQDAYSFRIQVGRELDEREAEHLAQLVGYEYAKTGGERGNDFVQDSPNSIIYYADSTKGDAERVDNFVNLVKDTVETGSPMRKTDRSGPGTAGTRLVDGLGDTQYVAVYADNIVEF